jgi:hypothetical protein
VNRDPDQSGLHLEDIARVELGGEPGPTPVSGGMISASFIGAFAIRALYVIFQKHPERLRSSARPAMKPASKPANKPGTEEAPANHQARGPG